MESVFGSGKRFLSSGVLAFLACVIIFLSFSQVVQAAPGDLDPTFDGDGKVITDVGQLITGQAKDDRATAIALQPDGKIVVVGYVFREFDTSSSSLPRTDWLIVRYNTDGTLDSTFGSGGIVTILPDPLNLAKNYAYAVAVKPDGKILVGGTAGEGSYALLQFMPNGTLDVGPFGNAGRLVLLSNSFAVIYGMALQPDGKIVIVGTKELVGYNLAAFFGRIQSNGNWWDGDGTTFYGWGFSWDDTAGDDVYYSVAVQPDGKILMAGESLGSGNLIFTRWNSSTTALDTGCTQMGLISGAGGGGHAIVLQPDGKILILGERAPVRMNPDCAWDTTFGNNGIAAAPSGVSWGAAFSMILQPDGKIVVAGYAFVGADYVFALARYNANGTLDTTFGTNGIIKTDVDLTVTRKDIAVALVQQSDGKLIAAGSGRFLTQFGSPGPPDTSSYIPGSTGSANYNIVMARYDNDVDTDGDGLYDSWETNGIDYNKDGTIDLMLPGANPNHKDLYVECDAMVGRAPTAATLQRVVDAFAAAPNALVNNPDGNNGISLHLEGASLVDEANMPVAPWPNTWGDFDPVKTARFGTVAQRGHANWANIREAKKLVYRYCIFADNYGDGKSSGIAELLGNDFMVTLGTWSTPGGTPDQQAGTFMHEFGHTLGLTHGGDQNARDPGPDGILGTADDVELFNYKPNYHSVMNYQWQFPKTGYVGWDLVYSTETFPDLNEANLNETNGIGGHALHMLRVGGPKGLQYVSESGPVDWNGVDSNGDGDKIDPGIINADINNVVGKPSPGQTLRGYEDWSHLQYLPTGSVGWADGVHPPADNISEMTFEIYEILNAPLGTPYDLSATAISAYQINLSWHDNSVDETEFKIERKLGIGGTYSQIATVGLNVATYSDTTGLSSATQYCYRVRAYNANGNSAYSNESCATTLNQSLAKFRVERSTGNVLADGSYNCGIPSSPGPNPPCYNSSSGSDLAEGIDVSESVEPGDLVEPDPNTPKHYRKARPNSTTASGVISSRPGMTMALQPGQAPLVVPQGQVLVLNDLTLSQSIENKTSSLAFSLTITILAQKQSTGDALSGSLSQWLREQAYSTNADGRPALALIGRVPVKVTTENGVIRVGDLLTASATKPGYAMRCTDAKQCEGAVIGKALEALNIDTGVILMLIMR